MSDYLFYKWHTDFYQQRLKWLMAAALITAHAVVSLETYSHVLAEVTGSTVTAIRTQVRHKARALSIQVACQGLNLLQRRLLLEAPRLEELGGAVVQLPQ